MIPRFLKYDVFELNFKIITAIYKKAEKNLIKFVFGSKLGIMKIDPKNDLFEYRFHYHLQDSMGFNDKYFMAHNYDEAREMFSYSCKKREVLPQVDKVEKWNRWAERWEEVSLSTQNPILN